MKIVPDDMKYVIVLALLVCSSSGIKFGKLFLKRFPRDVSEFGLRVPHASLAAPDHHHGAGNGHRHVPSTPGGRHPGYHYNPPTSPAPPTTGYFYPTPRLITKVPPTYLPPVVTTTVPDNGRTDVPIYLPPTSPPTDSPTTPPKDPRKNVPDHEHEHHEPGNPFSYSYEVRDEPTLNIHSRKADSDGVLEKGEYKVLLPDGREQHVVYTADWKHGYNAQVTYTDTGVRPDDLRNKQPVNGPY